MRKLTVLMMVAALSAGSAFAQDKKDGDKDGGKGNPNLPTYEMTLEELKWQCENWEASQGRQVQPKEIQIHCTQKHYRWVPEAPGVVEFPGQREVISEVTSNKFHVKEEARTREAPVARGSCPSFKEILESYTLNVPVTCEDLTKVSDLNEFCEGKVNPGKGGTKPKNVSIEETGHNYSTCGGQGGKDGEKPKI